MASYSGVCPQFPVSVPRRRVGTGRKVSVPIWIRGPPGERGPRIARITRIYSRSIRCLSPVGSIRCLSPVGTALRAVRCRLDAKAVQADNAGAVEKKNIQYTIRNVPERTDSLLREASVQYGKSLNDTVLSALQRGLGADAQPAEHHDLDALIGSWVHDEACDRALDEMDRVDAEMWS